MPGLGTSLSCVIHTINFIKGVIIMQHKKILCSFIALIAMAFVFSTMPVMAKSTSESPAKSSSRKSSTSKSKKTKKKSKSKSKKKSKTKKDTSDKKSSSTKKKSSKKKSSKASKTTKKKTGKVNINTADAKTLTELTGIGPVTAEKIVAYRKKNGKFKNAKDLMNVKGIGEKTLQKMKPKLKF
ncbi:MAG TPA: helix-hairpin-helix domain-containing protein [Desulfobulbus sp.]|nr:helix-hairpin-helix domain-containing protein [Desulfobulbus sp.]